jgi:arylsulfatase A-like enzyme
MTEYLQRRCRIEAVTETDERQIRAAYYGLCAEVDHHLGRLLDALDRSGRAGHTLVVFTSDHGDALGDHGLYGRRGPFEGHFRVPCIIHDPRPEADATRGTAVEALTANIDLLPTMARVLDQPVPPEVDGQALTPFLEGAAVTPWRSHVRYEMDWTDHIRRRDREALGAGPHRFTVVRTNRHRYVTFTTDHSSHATSLRPLLFDLHEDPEETVNRANDRALAAVRQHLAEMAD